MMSESLDGGAVTYRSSRHFDVLNENIVFDLKHWDSNLPKATDAYAYRTLLENRRNAYGQGLVLLNNTSHDERNLSDPWEAVIFSSALGMVDGITMIFPGQELGLSYDYGYTHFETGFEGKSIPHFKKWNSMMPLWQDTNFGNDQLFQVYKSIQKARKISPALQSPNRYFIDGVVKKTLVVKAGETYKFNIPNQSSHPFKFSTTDNGTHGGGVEYTTDVNTSGTEVTIVIPATGLSTLYYYCEIHQGMGSDITIN